MDFNLLDMYQLLLRENIFAVRPAAISLGGEQDIGQELEPEIKARLIKQFRESGFTFIYESDLQKNVAARMKIYSDGSSIRRIAAFINIGGSHANLGTSELALEVQPGLNTQLSIPPKPERGVLFEMAAERIPCIHLLFIKGLVMKYVLPWDPMPLPEPGKFAPNA
jgi:poly-gamma-glutamate system protein